MGVVNENAKLAEIINKLDDRLRALEQSKRFTIPYTNVFPTIFQNGDQFYLSGSSALVLGDKNGTAGGYYQQMKWLPYAGVTWTAGGVNVPLASGSYLGFCLNGQTVHYAGVLTAAGAVGAGTWSIKLPYNVNTCMGTAQLSNGAGTFTGLLSVGFLNSMIFYTTGTATAAYGPAVSSGYQIVFSMTCQSTDF